MSRGIVMETGSKHVVVLMPDGQFRKVRTALKPRIGEEFIFAEQRRMQRPRKLYSFSAGAAAIVLLLFAPVIAQHFNKPSSVVAYLTMDVNPSIELGINKDEAVEELRAINADGADVTKDLDYKGLPLGKVTEAIMDRISAGPYLNSGEGDVVITSIAVGAQVKPAEEVDLTAHMDTAVRDSLAKTEKGRQLQVEVTTLSAPKEIREEAKKVGLSSGKMAFYLMAKEHGYRVSIKQLKQESIHQAAKPMGGVAAVMNDDDGSSKPEGSQPGKTQPNKAQPNAALQQPDKSPKANSGQTGEAEKEAQREKQKKQLEELLKKEQENHDQRGDWKGGPDKKHGADPKQVLQNGGMINISEHSPGNNGKGSGGYKGNNGQSSQSGSHFGLGGGPVKNGQDGNRVSKSDGGNNGKSNGSGKSSGGKNSGDGKSNGSKAAANSGGQKKNNGQPEKASIQQQTPIGFTFPVFGGWKTNSNDNAQGGREEAKNASDSRHNGVNQGNAVKNAAIREDVPRAPDRDKQGDGKDSGKDRNNEKNNGAGSDRSSGSNKSNTNDKNSSKSSENNGNNGNENNSSKSSDKNSNNSSGNNSNGSDKAGSKDSGKNNDRDNGNGKSGGDDRGKQNGEQGNKNADNKKGR